MVKMRRRDSERPDPAAKQSDIARLEGLLAEMKMPDISGLVTMLEEQRAMLERHEDAASKDDIAKVMAMIPKGDGSGQGHADLVSMLEKQYEEIVLLRSLVRNMMQKDEKPGRWKFTIRRGINNEMTAVDAVAAE